MDKVNKSNSASVLFSSKAMELAKKSQPLGAGGAALAPFPLERPKLSLPPMGAPIRAPSMGEPGEAMDLSLRARELGAAQPPVATTIDAGAPKGASKRISAYGDAQKALAPKGSGFDGSA